MCVSSVVGSEDNNASKNTRHFSACPVRPGDGERLELGDARRQDRGGNPDGPRDPLWFPVTKFPNQKPNQILSQLAWRGLGIPMPDCRPWGWSAFFAKISSNRGIFLSLFRRFFRPSKRRTRRRITDARDRGDRSNRAQEVIQIPELIAPPP